MKYPGAEWLQRQLKDPLGPLACEAADVLGQVYRGIYHLPGSNWEPSRWSDPLYVWATVYGPMASVDFGHLTALVTLCHDRALRVEISPAGPLHLKLAFHRRKRSGKRQWEICPRLEDHVTRIRDHFGLPEVQS